MFFKGLSYILRHAYQFQREYMKTIMLYSRINEDTIMLHPICILS